MSVRSPLISMTIVAEAPTQWQAPLFRYLAASGEVDLTVVYSQVDVPIDVELGTVPKWDTDLLQGYRYYVLNPTTANLSRWTLNLVAGRATCDILLIPGWHHQLCRMVLGAALVVKPLAKRLVVFSDTNEISEKHPLRRTALGGLLHLEAAAGVRFASPGTRAREHLVAAGVPDHLLVRLPYAIDNDRFRDASSDFDIRLKTREDWGVGPEDVVFLCVAKMSERETPTEVVRAIQVVNRADTRAQLVIVGDGPDRNDLEREARRNVPGSVRFVGYVPYSELPACYNGADIFIHVPKREPWGLSVNEAVASGLPVITSRTVGSSYDLVDESRNGFIVEPTARSIASAMQRVLGMTADEWEHMKEHSFELAKRTHYEWWVSAAKDLAVPR